MHSPEARPAVVVGRSMTPQPAEDAMAHQQHQECIETCLACAQACEHCADACLREPNVAEMVDCIRLDRDCAELCLGAVAFMSRGSQFSLDFCRLCADACEACGAECRKHQMSHCHRCADACERCAEECRKMAGVGV